MAKEEPITVEAPTEALPNRAFARALSGARDPAHVSGKMCMHYIRTCRGQDHGRDVALRLTKGRIICRANAREMTNESSRTALRRSKRIGDLSGVAVSSESFVPDLRRKQRQAIIHYNGQEPRTCRVSSVSTFPQQAPRIALG
jgi:translation initiation factor IF-1